MIKFTFKRRLAFLREPRRNFDFLPRWSNRDLQKPDKPEELNETMIFMKLSIRKGRMMINERQKTNEVRPRRMLEKKNWSCYVEI